MQVIQYPALVSLAPGSGSFQITFVSLHLDALAAALRLSLALFLPSQAVAHEQLEPLPEPCRHEPKANPVEKVLVFENLLPAQREVEKIKYHQKGNSPKLTREAHDSREPLSRPRQECHSSEFTLREEIQKPQTPIRKSKKVARTSLFMKNRETRGSMKVVRRREKGKERRQRLGGNAVIEWGCVISMQQKREELLRRQVLQWRISKQEGAVFGREYRYLMQ